MLQRRYGDAGHHQAKAADGSALALQLAIRPGDWHPAEYEAALKKVQAEEDERRRRELLQLAAAEPPPAGPTAEELELKVIALLQVRDRSAATCDR